MKGGGASSFGTKAAGCGLCGLCPDTDGDGDDDDDDDDDDEDEDVDDDDDDDDAKKPVCEAKGGRSGG